MEPIDIETFYNTADLKRFHCPATLIWGVDSRERLYEIVPAQGSIALFVDAFFRDDSFIQQLRTRLADRLVLEVSVSTMPMTDHIDRAVQELGAMPAIAIALGGGSTIDTAKAVISRFLYGTYDGVGLGPRRGMSTIDGVSKPLLITLPTTAGTGADTSRYYVLYQSKSRAKVSGKSWRLVADWSLLDPWFLRSATERQLVAWAFDSYVHFFESFLCRYERSWFGDMLSVDGMVRTVNALSRVVDHRDRDQRNLLELLYAASVGGMAISNVRAGNIHEAAGALLEYSDLTHPESLFVFYRDALEQYRAEIGDRERLFGARMREVREDLGIECFESAFAWWERTFESCGLTAAIRAMVAGISASPRELKQHISQRVAQDAVWTTKEGPILLDNELIDELIVRALGRFGYAGHEAGNDDA